jgi:rRNA-processing protein FCF1
MASVDKQRNEKLDALKKDLKRVENELRDNRQITDEMLKRQRILNSESYTIKNSISQLEQQQKDIVVSDHAVLRYLQRKRGIPVEETRSEIASMFKNLDPTLGELTVSGFVIKGNSVITYKV